MNVMALSESSPEKAGVGGSIPSLATTVFLDLQPFHSPQRQPWSPIGMHGSRLANVCRCGDKSPVPYKDIAQTGAPSIPRDQPRQCRKNSSDEELFNRTTRLS
jgi:hypothetical protein